MFADKVLLAGIGAPTTINELIWYAFGLLASYFLWSIRTELTNIRTDLKDEKETREKLTARVVALEARCDERHK
jgi:hypothetical protein